MMQFCFVILLLTAFFSVTHADIIVAFIWLSVFSLLSSLIFLWYAAPDVAIAEAVVSTLSTIVFLVAVQKYLKLPVKDAAEKKSVAIKKYIPPLAFVIFLSALFIWSAPGDSANTYLKDEYIAWFRQDVGGDNAVTSIYLGFRMYDTVFEALMLLVSVTAVIHLSWYKDKKPALYNGRKNKVNAPMLSDSIIAESIIRFICPLFIVFGLYLIANGHLSPGGGFQGGVVLSAFFICRFIKQENQNISLERIKMLEKIIYAGIILLAAVFIFMGAYSRFPEMRNLYMITMNLLIGLKVACGFQIIFYRFFIYERM